MKRVKRSRIKTDKAKPQRTHKDIDGNIGYNEDRDKEYQP